MNTSAETPEEGKRFGPMPTEVENKLTEYIMQTGFQLEIRKYLRHGARWGYASLERENAELKEKLHQKEMEFTQLLAEFKDKQDQAETIKRYKEALEAVQRITKDDRPILAQIISSALSGTNE